MAFSIIIILYVAIGLMSAAGSVFIAYKLFSPKVERAACHDRARAMNAP